MKSCQIKGSLNSSVRKIIQFLETEEAANTPTSIHIKRFTGCVGDWIILNKDWPI